MNLAKYWFMMLDHYKRNVEPKAKAKTLDSEEAVTMFLFNKRNT